MQPYETPPAKPGMSALSIALIVLGALLVLTLGTCAAGVFWVGREAKKFEAEIRDGGAVVVLASPPAVVAELAGAKKDYVGAWSSARGSTLRIDADGSMKFDKDEDGDGIKEKITAPIAAFRGDDLEVKMVVTLFVRVTQAPHKVGDHWEMTADGVALERR